MSSHTEAKTARQSLNRKRIEGVERPLRITWDSRSLVRTVRSLLFRYAVSCTKICLINVGSLQEKRMSGGGGQRSGGFGGGGGGGFGSGGGGSGGGGSFGSR